MGMSECLIHASRLENIKPNWAKFRSFQGVTVQTLCGEEAVHPKHKKEKMEMFLASGPWA